MGKVLDSYIEIFFQIVSWKKVLGKAIHILIEHSLAESKTRARIWYLFLDVSFPCCSYESPLPSTAFLTQGKIHKAIELHWQKEILFWDLSVLPDSSWAAPLFTEFKYHVTSWQASLLSLPSFSIKSLGKDLSMCMCKRAPFSCKKSICCLKVQ